MLHLGRLGGATGARADDRAPDWPRRFAALAASARDPRLRRYHAAGAAAGTTPISAVPMVALDIETTGLDPARHEIVSVAIVPLTLAQIDASATRHWIVQPRGELAAGSVAFHGITHSQVAAAPDFDAIVEPLLDAIAGRVVVVHSRSIERGFLDAALRARSGEGIEFPVVDTMDLEARRHRQRSGWLGWRAAAPAPSLRLADCRVRAGLPAYRAHHAPTDALATAELLLAQIARDHDPSTPLRQLWR